MLKDKKRNILEYLRSFTDLFNFYIQFLDDTDRANMTSYLNGDIEVPWKVLFVFSTELNRNGSNILDSLVKEHIDLLRRIYSEERDPSLYGIKYDDVKKYIIDEEYPPVYFLDETTTFVNYLDFIYNVYLKETEMVEDIEVEEPIISFDPSSLSHKKTDPKRRQKVKEYRSFDDLKKLNFLHPITIDKIYNDIVGKSGINYVVFVDGDNTSIHSVYDIVKNRNDVYVIGFRLFNQLSKKDIDLMNKYKNFGLFPTWTNNDDAADILMSFITGILFALVDKQLQFLFVSKDNFTEELNLNVNNFGRHGDRFTGVTILDDLKEFFAKQW